MIIEEQDYLAHYGILRKSGRYPWGSGEDESTRSAAFLSQLQTLRKQGVPETVIAEGFGMTTGQLRDANTIARASKKAADIAWAQRLKDKGMSNAAIGEKMGGLNESSVRALLAPGLKDKTDILIATSNMLRDEVDKKGMVDVGVGNEHFLGISSTKLGTALAVLKDEGYEVHNIQIDQATGKGKTTYKVLSKPGTTYRDIVTNLDGIQSLSMTSGDGGRHYDGFHPPLSIDSSRVGIRYKKDGGADADGVIYVRPGVKDVELGGSSYAQVRVAVDGTHYLKGMAVYKKDLPDGVDLLFNTNKDDTGNKLDALKPMKTDKDGKVDVTDPFGSAIDRQIKSYLPDGAFDKVTSAMNLVNEEGRWDQWGKNLASQFLSKQKPSLAEQQLNETVSRKKTELDEINALTNPVVKRSLLESYADGADSAAVHLKAAALPRQRTQVILPINSLKDNEIYAPNFHDGERVALVRYPHGGTFEIPDLVVNNRNREGKDILKQAADAVGINSRVAERLSGADFDGDTVLVIPNNHGQVLSTPALTGLKNFDPKTSYPSYEGMPKMSAKQKQSEMGKVSNLITDMTIRDAPPSEIARAVRHSMVVIDAEKHNLNYRQSAIDNNIKQLKEKYQGGANKGAATLISRSTSDVRVNKRHNRVDIDPETGKLIRTETGEHHIQTKVNKRTGEVTEKKIFKTEKSTKGAETDDAHDLSSGTKIEEIYADHANRMKALANEARLSMVRTENTPYSPSANKVYVNEVSSLKAKLNLALRNAPLERQAQLIADQIVRAKKDANPDMDGDDLKKVKGKAINEARDRVGAGKDRIDITPDEWDAIQAGAISNSMLEKIIRNSDLDKIKELATPRAKPLMTGANLAKAQRLLSSGHTQAEVAAALGISLTTLKAYI